MTKSVTLYFIIFPDGSESLPYTEEEVEVRDGAIHELLREEGGRIVSRIYVLVDDTEHEHPELS